MDQEPLPLQQSRLIQRIATLVYERHVDAVEVLYYVITFLCGVRLLLPIPVFDTSITYNAMAWLPEWFWGLWMVLIGGFGLWAYHQDIWEARRKSTAATGILWVFITIMFLIGNPRGLTACIWVPSILWLSWTHWRLRREQH